VRKKCEKALIAIIQGLVPGSYVDVPRLSVGVTSGCRPTILKIGCFIHYYESSRSLYPAGTLWYACLDSYLRSCSNEGLRKAYSSMDWYNAVPTLRRAEYLSRPRCLLSIQSKTFSYSTYIEFVY
jgi:hypothetical protein